MILLTWKSLMHNPLSGRARHSLRAQTHPTGGTCTGADPLGAEIGRDVERLAPVPHAARQSEADRAERRPEEILAVTGTLQPHRDGVARRSGDREILAGGGAAPADALQPLDERRAVGCGVAE